MPARVIYLEVGITRQKRQHRTWESCVSLTSICATRVSAPQISVLRRSSGRSMDVFEKGDGKKDIGSQQGLRDGAIR
eukprot:1205550-Rhodomonas_salina.2